MRVECNLKMHGGRVSITEESTFEFEIVVFRKERIFFSYNLIAAEPM
jgi:hypothetical protein